MDRTALTVVIPSYNSEAYLDRAMATVLDTKHRGVEVIIVNDGSKDGTAALADTYVARDPRVKVIHQMNKGHGGAVNAGIQAATGRYLKVLDSDDWFNVDAFYHVLATLDSYQTEEEAPDLILTNYVYEKEGKRTKKVMHYRKFLPTGRNFGWEDLGHFPVGVYLMMHSLLYKTSILKAGGFALPEHTFYVDNLFVCQPLVRVKTMRYLDVDLYRYHIGRHDQSVNPQVMLKRIDQQIRVNKLLIQLVKSKPAVHPSLMDYLLHHATVVTVISSTVLLLPNAPEHTRSKFELWDYVRSESPELAAHMRKTFPGRMVNLPGRTGRFFTRLAYRIANHAYGFN